MNRVRFLVNILRGDKRAVTALEYGLIAGVLVVTVLVGFNTLGSNLMTKFNDVAGDVANPSAPTP